MLKVTLLRVQANSVPAAAVIQNVRVLFGVVEFKKFVGVIVYERG